MVQRPSVFGPFTLKEFIGKNLDGYTIEEVTIVNRVSEDGMYPKPVACFRDPNLAQVYKDDDQYLELTTNFALISPEGGVYVFEGGTPLTIADKTEAEKLRQQALAKLSDVERKLLGL